MASRVRPSSKRSLTNLCILLCVLSHSIPSAVAFHAVSAVRTRKVTFSPDGNAGGPRRLGTDDANENDTIDKPIEPPSVKKEVTSRPAASNEMTSNQIMRAMGTSPRRIFLSVASSTFIALGANFFGLTSGLLSLAPEELAESSRLDTYYPRGDFKRVRGGEYGYSYVIPKEWVADQYLELAKAQRRSQTLDYSMAMTKPDNDPNRGGRQTLPDTAFGPPGRLDSRGVSRGDTNVSLIATQVNPGFTLQSVSGGPRNAAETLLRVSLAPECSGKTATLLAAYADSRGSDGVVVYQFEYNIDRGQRNKPLRAISVISHRKETLMTLTVVAPAVDWEEKTSEAKLRKVADSFKLTR